MIRLSDEIIEIIAYQRSWAFRRKINGLIIDDKEQPSGGSVDWPFIICSLKVIKRWSVAESFTIFENHVYSHLKNLIFARKCVNLAVKLIAAFT